MPSVRCGSSMPPNCFLPSSTRASKSGASRRQLADEPQRRNQIARADQQRGEHELSNRIRVGAGCVEHRHAAVGHCRDRNVVGAGAGATDRFHGGRNRHRMHVVRAHQDRVGMVDLLADDIAVGRKPQQRLRRDVVQRENLKFRHFDATRFGVAFELAQIVDQRLHAFDRHRVVDRCAHAADRAVPLQLQQAALLRAFQKCAVERLVAQLERHVHPRAVFLAHRVVVELAGIERVVQQLRLRDVLLFDRSQPALRQRPLEHQAGDVNRIGRRRVQHRIAFGLLLPVERRRRDRQARDRADPCARSPASAPRGRRSSARRRRSRRTSTRRSRATGCATTCPRPAALCRRRAPTGTRRRRSFRWCTRARTRRRVTASSSRARARR